MSDRGEIELPLGSEVEETDAMSAFNVGVQLDIPKMEARQAEIDGILAKNYRNPDYRVRDLNAKIAKEWDDDFGISYIHIAGASLPGLEMHGAAEKMAFSANDAPNANFEGASLTASVFTATSLPGLRARGATMDDALFGLASLEGADMEDVSAVDVQFNFADLTDIKGRGAILTSSFLIATRGLTQEIFGDIADVAAARALIQESTGLKSSEKLRHVLSDRFIDTQAEDVLRDLDPVRILRGVKIANALPDQKNLEGVVLDDMILTGTRLPGRQMTGSLWHRVHGRGMVLRGMKAAGLVVVNSDLQDSDASRLWVPGMFAANTNLRNMSMPGANLGGAVLLNAVMENMDLENSNMDGMVLVGGRPPELDSETRKRLKITELDKLPSRVADNIMRLGMLSISTTQAAPELEK